MQALSKKKIDMDFGRDVWCIFGLPFDNYSIAKTCDVMDNFINEGQRCVVSNPNLDWIAGSLKDREFKEVIISSDISVIDGSPILWAARVLGIGITDKVPGSSLIEYMMKQKKGKKYRVFFFGGEKGVARRAAAALRKMKIEMKVAGYFYPGFGSIDDMSRDDVISLINKTKPNIILVSLSAMRGMLWIDRNKRRLKAEILAPFGAVINFVAGSVKRAPLWIQRCGIEWLWRIKEEPVLWTRYLRDGLVFIRIVITRVIPYSVFLVLNKRYSSLRQEARISTDIVGQAMRIKIRGVCNHSNIAALRESFKAAAGMNRDVLIDLSATKYIDSSFLGCLLLLYKYQKAQSRRLTVIGANRKVKNIFRFNMLDDIITLRNS